MKVLFLFSAIFTGNIMGILTCYYLGWLPVKEVLVLSQINICEQRGGKYSLYWSDFEHKYEGRCRTQEGDIKL